MTASTIAISLVFTLHIVFFILESILWTTPKVRRLFMNSAEAAKATKVLAQNQGFYNLGAALLLMWFHCNANIQGTYGILIFLACMGVVGGLTANKVILFFQSLPAIMALIIIYCQQPIN